MTGNFYLFSSLRNYFVPSITRESHSEKCDPQKEASKQMLDIKKQFPCFTSSGYCCLVEAQETNLSLDLRAMSFVSWLWRFAAKIKTSRAAEGFWLMVRIEWDLTFKTSTGGWNRRKKKQQKTGNLECSWKLFKLSRLLESLCWANDQSIWYLPYALGRGLLIGCKKVKVFFRYNAILSSTPLMNSCE